jgi:hypothetical protein
VFTLKRQDLVEFLKEVLRVCGDSIIMEMVWLDKISAGSKADKENYQLVIKSRNELSGQEHLTKIIEKYGLKMEKQDDNLWFFSRNKSTK